MSSELSRWTVLLTGYLACNDEPMSYSQPPVQGIKPLHRRKRSFHARKIPGSGDAKRQTFVEIGHDLGMGRRA